MAEQLSSEQIEIIQEFIQECIDLLDHLEPTIIGFAEFTKQGPFLPTEESMPVMHEVFRLFHSIKGSAGFLNFSFMASTAHAAENLLDQIRKGQLPMTNEHVDLFCQTCDFMRECLDHVAVELNDGCMEGQAKELSGQLKAALEGGGVGVPALPRASATEAPPEAEPVMAVPDLAITPELVEAFLQEANEQLQEVEHGLLVWSKDSDNKEVVAELFRKIHSFKGNCGFLGFGDLERLSHRMETVLDAVKSGTCAANAKPADALLNLCDVLKNSLGEISQKSEGRIDGLDLYLELLDDFIPAELKSESSVQPPRVGEILVESGVITPETLFDALDIQKKPIGEVLVGMGAVLPEQVDQALFNQEQIKGAPVAEQAKQAASLKRQDIRVDLEKIDTLIDLIGEMVIAENMLIHSPDLAGLVLENFSKASQQMSKLVKELQEVAMTIRMVPVAGLFNRMTRLVHDLARKSGKKADLVLVGMETELDKTVIEKITDPLVHLIRNSMDHALESPQERLAAGKKETGIVRLTASHEEGEVWIRIEDDGRGLNREKILKKALEKGLVQGDGSNLTDKDVAALIFLPGFSTADKVTDVSGRGVGMDVVKQNLNQIDGKIDIDSKPGAGTKIVLRIPLTMAIIDGMLVRVGDVRYIIPILSIRESFRPLAKAITVSPDGQELVRVRDRLFPVLRLHRLHKIEPASELLDQGILILLENQGRNVCLFVDEILGQQQTVIKGLSEYIGKVGQVRCVSGCTILSDGEVCLILEVRGLTEIVVETVGND
ncbi:MAG: chemotaxis protein CheA [Desulfobulbaceae bacterium]|nr:chemotaxis protein CheA [Desulfobulbaceae bacterium]HIJ89993.1 chemotaxis protein CheA [Deltaproteobacteria bacterium]